MDLSRFRVRNFQQPEDVAGLLILLNDVEFVDGSGEDISEAALQTRLKAAGHNPQQDRWVVEHPNDSHVFIGHGAIWHATDDTGSIVAEVDLVVNPQWRRQGIGSLIFTAILIRARQLGSNYVRVYADSHHVAAETFLKQKQFSPVSAYVEMRATELKSLNLLPNDYSVVPYASLNSPSLLVTAYNDCFTGQWGHQRVTLEIIEQSLAYIDANGLFLLFDPDQSLVGMCRSEHSAPRTERNVKPTGYIDAPGMIPTLHETHLYGGLLLHAARWLYDSDAIVELESWGNAPETIELYQELGFVMLRQQYAYQRSLEHGTA